MPGMLVQSRRDCRSLESSFPIFTKALMKPKHVLEVGSLKDDTKKKETFLWKYSTGWRGPELTLSKKRTEYLRVYIFQRMFPSICGSPSPAILEGSHTPWGPRQSGPPACQLRLQATLLNGHGVRKGGWEGWTGKPLWFPSSRPHWVFLFLYLLEKCELWGWNERVPQQKRVLPCLPDHFFFLPVSGFPPLFAICKSFRALVPGWVFGPNCQSLNSASCYFLHLGSTPNPPEGAAAAGLGPALSGKDTVARVWCHSFLPLAMRFSGLAVKAHCPLYDN